MSKVDEAIAVLKEQEVDDKVVKQRDAAVKSVLQRHGQKMIKILGTMINSVENAIAKAQKSITALGADAEIMGMSEDEWDDLSDSVGEVFREKGIDPMTIEVEMDNLAIAREDKEKTEEEEAAEEAVSHTGVDAVPESAVDTALNLLEDDDEEETDEAEDEGTQEEDDEDEE